ncbi:MULTISPECIES: ATP-binding cassette domain-containing protein [Pseudonocardia]|uniref:ABC transporter ATP-binding protein YtrB n=2 Tax=Pseudonocardia TaxID=1847 RepID=A0A1Y2MGN5_PSEAH|nr:MULTISPECIES: ABC transporter ATP-binding protein [Pseudonocardia]OSY34435.1 ABC transporter ATP-binding protein YtrB [Pseudonocardia autotrophica]TDN72009.1 ABC-2 type transport system ATP-binding protein [Pseudonocardia autotrophica]BBG02698.1 ABC transporter ATP-binding protein [Pseudonocardia autotrophica]GEC29727.1 ABC transporter ATP-binding protein [Pseudonocardia saturnea]
MTTAEIVAVRTSGLGRRHGRTRALRDCALTVEPGSVVALTGAPGAGKSTLLGLLAGLDVPSEGTAEVLGAPVPAGGPHPAVGYLDQARPLPASFTVHETLRLGRALNPGRWDDDRAADLVGALPHGSRVQALSSGQRAMLAVALVLGSTPDLLLLDEPLAGLDPLTRRRVLAAVTAHVANTGAAAVLASHEIEDLQNSCDRVLFLDRGRVLIDSDTDDLLTEHRLLDGPAGSTAWSDGHTVVEQRVHGRNQTVLVRGGPIGATPGWRTSTPGLLEVITAYLRTADDRAEDR